MGIFGDSKELKKKIVSLEEQNEIMKKDFEELQKQKDLYVNAYNTLWHECNNYRQKYEEGLLTCRECFQKIRREFVFCPYCGNKIESVLGEMNTSTDSSMINDNIFQVEEDLDGYLIVGYNGFSDRELTIPSSVYGKKVTGIGNSVFEKCQSLISVIFEEGCMYIGKAAFLNCENLRRVKLPESLKEIGRSAFANCHNLQHVALPNNVEVLGDSAFSNCKSLKTVILSERMKSISSSTFSSTNIEKIVIPDTILHIGKNAFSKSAIREIELSHNLQIIQSEAFLDCRNLKRAVLHSHISKIGKRAFDGTNVTIYCAAGTEAQRYARLNGLEAKQISPVNRSVPKEKIVEFFTIKYKGYYPKDAMYPRYAPNWVSLIENAIGGYKASRWAWRITEHSHEIDIWKVCTEADVNEIMNRLKGIPVEVSPAFAENLS